VFSDYEKSRKEKHMFTEMSLNQRLTKGLTTAVLATALSIGAASAYGQATGTGSQTKGTSKQGTSKQGMKDAENGWSAKKNIIDKAVYNDNNEKIGNVDDVIFSRSKSAASFAVIGVGGFLGAGTHDVAVPLSEIKHEGDKLILPGATKDALKAMPEFKYASSSGKTDERTSSNRTTSEKSTSDKTSSDKASSDRPSKK
jgi:sporulation protein YlmC with PRC-barrel domain